MKVIFFGCASGETSNSFCSKIEKSSRVDKIFIDDVVTILKNYDKGIYDEYDFVFAYGAASNVTAENIKKYGALGKIDFVLICPQARYLMPQIKKVLEPYGVQSELIDTKVFEKMNGTQGIDFICDCISKKR